MTKNEHFKNVVKSQIQSRASHKTDEPAKDGSESERKKSIADIVEQLTEISEEDAQSIKSGKIKTIKSRTKSRGNLSEIAEDVDIEGTEDTSSRKS